MSGQDDPTVVTTGEDPASSSDHFTPGTVIGGRYRIISLLGTGGMGRVYRADDLKLGQRVALKHVPTALEANRESLEMVYAEVRIGRQISHPNVCRLYDVVEVEGQHFVSMDYIDGEDLSSLLHRIGRLPPEKALMLAHDICAGLAAAHDKGVIHRDLKPANIMIDGHGHAQITDLGLAALAAEVPESGMIAGTPAYMAPEQLRGGRVTTRSDIYALGLLLYEMFTGQRVFDGGRLKGIASGQVPPKRPPSSIVRDIDPVIERLILRCLEDDPVNRPATVREVIDELPERDQLKAALAAGETPSPEVVAGAGSFRELSPGVAWGLLGLVLLSLLIAVAVGQLTLLPNLAGEIKPPEVLEDRSREVLRALDLNTSGDDHGRFVTNERALERTAESGDVLSVSDEQVIEWYWRLSPRALDPRNQDGLVLTDDPPEIVPGMATVVLRQNGYLRELRSVPTLNGGRSDPFDWSAAFDLAGLDFSRFDAVAPESIPPHAYDRHVAWRAESGSPSYVEAASMSGSPVWFRVFDGRPDPPQGYSEPSIGAVMFSLIVLVAIVAGAIIARRNVLRGRGDRRGAIRVGITVTVLKFCFSIALAHHVTNFVVEWSVISRIAALSLYRGVTAWILYLAIEPYVRRQWPRMLVSWSRLVAGKWRDPLVGRDLLIGLATGALALAIYSLDVPLSYYIGSGTEMPENPLARFHITAPLGFLWMMTQPWTYGIFATLSTVTILVTVRLVVRSYGVSLVLVAFLMVIAIQRPTTLASWITGTLGISLFFFVLHRYGAFAFGAANGAVSLLRSQPLTLDLGAWYSTHALLALLCLIALAALGFYLSLGGQPVFGRDVLDEAGRSH